jgi:hypothetical protein
LWDITTPLEGPVVPEVYWMQKSSSPVTPVSSNLSFPLYKVSKGTVRRRLKETAGAGAGSSSQTTSVSSVSSSSSIRRTVSRQRASSTITLASLSLIR